MKELNLAEIENVAGGMAWWVGEESNNVEEEQYLMGWDTGTTQPVGGFGGTYTF